MAQQFLSFNEQINSGANFGLKEDEDEAAAQALKEPLKLKDTWVLWEQVQNDNSGKDKKGYETQTVAKFDTVQEFWKIWNGVPQPSELMGSAEWPSKRIMRDPQTGSSVAVDALMIFKDGIAPEWEDPKNTNGGHFQVQLKPQQVCGGQIDECWNNVVLGMVGGTLEPTELITGIRLVDKLLGKPNSNSHIRIELWYTNHHDTASVNALKKNFESCITTQIDGSKRTGTSWARPDMKQHGGLGKH